ncbi:hypothetical protein DSECCO2_446740 [anaerobic digester metagenome]
MSVDIFGARFGIEFDTGDTGSVLSPVVLLFHQQMQLIEAPGRGTVAVKVILQGFQQPYHGNAAFVLDLLAH